MHDTEVLDQLFGVTPANEHEPAAVPATLIFPDSGSDELRELPIALLQDFPADKHPFRPYTQEKLEALRQDIIERGIIQPLIVRPLAEDKFEIISGHNRRTAAREAGYIVLPCIVRNLDDDEALLQMLSTNLQQRSDLRYSEKAFAYKIQMETMKRQAGRPPKDNLSQAGTQKRSDQLLAERAGESRNQIQRYIRLTYLIPALLDLVDEKKIGFTIGETLSYLTQENQQIVEDFFFEQRSRNLDQRLADELRKMEASGEITPEALEAAFLSPALKLLRKVSISMKPIQKWFRPDATEKEIQTTILEALKLYFDRKTQ